MLPPGRQWYHRVLAELAAGGDGFDLMVFDYHYLAELVEGHYLAPLEAYFNQSDNLPYQHFQARILTNFSQYPANQQEYWALPLYLDSLGIIYRRDLLEDPQENKQFKQQYGYPLKPPKSRSELLDIAEYFSRHEISLYGWGQVTSETDSQMTSSLVNFIWSYGGELLSLNQDHVVGYLDSDQSIRGIEQYIKMLDFMPDSPSHWHFEDLNQAFKEGKIALGLQWYSSLDELNKYSKDRRFGFVPFPSNKGLMGGKAIAINRFSEHKIMAWEFLEWFFQLPQQQVFMQPANRVIKDESVKAIKPNSPLTGFWQIPEYAQFNEILQQEVGAALHKEKTVIGAVKMAARRQELVLRKGAYK